MRRAPTPLVSTGLLLLGGLAPSAGAQTPLEVEGLPAGAPLAVSASATPRALFVDLQLEPEWHAYSRDVGGGRPVALRVDGGCDFEAAGPLDLPRSDDGQLVGAVRISLPLDAIDPERDGVLAATLDLQVCDALECLAPMTLQISGEVERLDVLLVVASAGERADRIGAWLRERSFAPVVTTYESVTAAACDAADVVVADSDVFQKHGVGMATVRAFPRTETPIVAVGFLGTELVEAHGLAMTSGYI